MDEAPPPRLLAVALGVTTTFFLAVSSVLVSQFNADNDSDDKYYTAAVSLCWTNVILWVIAFVGSIEIGLQAWSDECSIMKNVSGEKYTRAVSTFVVQCTSALLQVTQLMTILYLLGFNFNAWGHFAFFGNYGEDWQSAVWILYIIALISFYFDARLLYTTNGSMGSDMSTFTALFCTRLLVFNLVLCCIPLAKDGADPPVPLAALEVETMTNIAWTMFVGAIGFDLILTYWVIYSKSRKDGYFRKHDVKHYVEVNKDETLHVVTSEGTTTNERNKYQIAQEVARVEYNKWNHIVCYIILLVLLVFNAIRCYYVDIFTLNYVYIASAAVYSVLLAAGFTFIKPTSDTKGMITNDDYLDYTFRLCSAILPPALLFTIFGLIMHTEGLEDLVDTNKYYASATIAFVIWVGYAIDIRMKSASEDKTGSMDSNKGCCPHMYTSIILFVVYAFLLGHLIAHMWEWLNVDNISVTKIIILLHFVGLGLLGVNMIVFVSIWVYSKWYEITTWTTSKAESLQKTLGFVNFVVVFIFLLLYFLWTTET